MIDLIENNHLFGITSVENSLYLYAKNNSEATKQNMRATRSRIEKAMKATLLKAEQSTSNLKTFLKAIRQFTVIEEIEVFEQVKFDGKLHLPVKIHSTAVGLIDITTDKEILRVMEKIRNNSKPQKTA